MSPVNVIDPKVLLVLFTERSEPDVSVCARVFTLRSWPDVITSLPFTVRTRPDVRPVDPIQTMEALLLPVGFPLMRKSATMPLLLAPEQHVLGPTTLRTLPAPIDVAVVLSIIRPTPV